MIDPNYKLPSSLDVAALPSRKPLPRLNISKSVTNSNPGSNPPRLSAEGYFAGDCLSTSNLIL